MNETRPGKLPATMPKKPDDAPRMGRPPVLPEDQERVTVRLPADHVRRIEAIAGAGRVAGWIRELVARELGKGKNR